MEVLKSSQPQTIVLTLLLGAVIGFGAGWYTKSNTKLLPGERRIAGIATEIERRVPEFKAVRSEFVACMSKGNCDSTSILAKREEIIALHWPSISERFLVFSDWGTGYGTLYERDDFFTEVGNRTKEQVVAECKPVIKFLWHESAMAIEDKLSCDVTPKRTVTACAIFEGGKYPFLKSISKLCQ